MSDLPKTKEELVSQIEREWTALLDVVAQLNGTQMTTPDAGGWSPKDNLAHLAEWMKIQLGYHMDQRPSHEVIGVSPEVTKDWDFNVINQLLFERNRGRTVEDVLGELKQVYAQLMERLRATPFEEFLRPRFPEHPESPPLLAFLIGNTSEHFEEHRQTIQKVLEG